MATPAGYCADVCFGVGFPGSPANSACLAACEGVGGFFSTRPDPPLPIAFDPSQCCGPAGLNTGWALTGASSNPLMAVEYQ